VHWRIRNPLPKPLMGSGLIEIHNICFEKPRELFLMQDEEVIQTFSPHAPQKTFTDSICPARVRYGVRSTLIPLVVATRAKFEPNFRSLSRIRYLGVCPYGVASRSCCATQRSVGERVTFTWIRLPRLQFDDEEGKERTEEKIRDPQEITGPPPPTPPPHDCAGTFSSSVHGLLWDEPAA
jgi:hypothetical protein